MLNINNNAANVKREILVKIAKLQLNGRLEEKEINRIPKELAPKDKQSIRCCIYHDREILKLRTVARLGISVENCDEDKVKVMEEEENDKDVKLKMVKNLFGSDLNIIE